jgi:YVTN family beta-propeller protein
MRSNSYRGASVRFLTLTFFLVFGASVAAAQVTKAYVGNQPDGTVSVIDTVTNTVTATIAVGGEPRAIAATPDGAFVYVTNTVGDFQTVSVIDTATNTVVDTMRAGLFPGPVAITPDGAFAYVANTRGCHPRADSSVTCFQQLTSRKSAISSCFGQQ